MSEATSSVNMTYDPGNISNRSKRMLGWGILIVVIVIGAVFFLAYHHNSEVRRGTESDMAQKENTLVGTRAEMTDAWLDSLLEQSQRLVSSDLFQMFASEVDKLPGGVPLLLGQVGEDGGKGADSSSAGQLFSQLPLMRTMLSEFISYSGFAAARIVNSKAETYITTEVAMPPLNTAQRRIVQEVLDMGAIVYGPLEIGSRGTTMDIYLPVMAPAYQGGGGTPVAVIVFSQVMDAKLAEILIPNVVGDVGRKLKMVQKNGSVYQLVVPGSNLLRSVPDFEAEGKEPLPFALRKGFGEIFDVYSSGVRLRSTDWWLVAEYDAGLIDSALDEKEGTIYMLAGLVCAVFVLLIAVAWWRLVGREQRIINSRVNDLLTVIDTQKRLLDSINSTISDPISLTDDKGVYRYVNTAFAFAVGRTAEDVVGLDGPAVFGFDTAKRLNVSDQHVLMTGESISITEVLWLQSRRYNFQICKTPLRDPDSRTPQGIVSVFRDITQLVETQERGQRVVQQTINALVRAIEEVDPFLGGHSRIMSGLAALVAKHLRLSDKDTATIEAAATLSQIGKMFVPRDILLKPGVLTTDEKAKMEQHVEYSRVVLKEIEFDLPVVEAIYQMNERLDGKGYPCGLSGADISIHARVLAVANAFTAMAKPRSYRLALSVEDAMSVLERQTASYDQDVVASLWQVLSTQAGEKIVAQAASSKAM